MKLPVYEPAVVSPACNHSGCCYLLYIQFVHSPSRKHAYVHRDEGGREWGRGCMCFVYTSGLHRDMSSTNGTRETVAVLSNKRLKSVVPCIVSYTRVLQFARWAEPFVRVKKGLLLTSVPLRWTRKFTSILYKNYRNFCRCTIWDLPLKMGLIILLFVVVKL